MSWKSGGKLFDSLVEVIAANVPDDECRREIYVVMVNEFDSMDYDGVGESIGVDDVLDEVIKDKFPDYFDKEDDEESEDEE